MDGPAGFSNIGNSHFEDDFANNNQNNFANNPQNFGGLSPPSYNEFIQENKGGEGVVGVSKEEGVKDENGFENDSYSLKDILFKGKKATIIMQNKNGPCPLLAIANILLLSSSTSIRSNTGKIKTSQLLDLIAEHLTSTSSKVEIFLSKFRLSLFLTK